MGLATAKLKISNTFTRRPIEIDAVADAGAISLRLTENQARQLGYDTSETQTALVTLADREQTRLPKLKFVDVEFLNPSCSTDALVLGDQAVLGVVPLELMDLEVDPAARKLIPDPLHPNEPVLFVKGTPR